MIFRHKRHKTAPTIIIVALVDILIVLLIFLIVTTTFKQSSTVRLILPESRQAKSGASDKPSRLLIVEIESNSPYLRLEGTPVTIEKLEAELKRRARDNLIEGVAIRADARAPFEQIVKVMDAARSAEITNLTAFVKKPGQK